MKNWILILGIFFLIFSPLALKAETDDELPLFTVRSLPRFSRIIDQFYDRFSELFIDMNIKMSEVLEVDTEALSCLEKQHNFNREKHLEILRFIILGIHPYRYTDAETLAEFQELQNKIFIFFLKDLKRIVEVIFDNKINDECFDHMEQQIIREIQDLSYKSKDLFLNQQVPAFLINASSRLDVFGYAMLELISFSQFYIDKKMNELDAEQILALKNIGKTVQVDFLEICFTLIKELSVVCESTSSSLKKQI